MGEFLVRLERIIPHWRWRLRRAALAPFLFLGLLHFSAAIHAAAPEGSALLELADGGVLHGTLEALSEGELQWRHPAAPAPIALRTEGLSQIRFQGAKPLPRATKPTSRLQFRNGDTLLGTLQSIDTRT